MHPLSWMKKVLFHKVKTKMDYTRITQAKICPWIMLYAFNYCLIHENNSASSKRISPNYAYSYEKLQTVTLPQFLTDQLTLLVLESVGEIMPTPLLLAPGFQHLSMALLNE